MLESAIKKSELIQGRTIRTPAQRKMTAQNYPLDKKTHPIQAIAIPHLIQSHPLKLFRFGNSSDADSTSGVNVGEFLNLAGKELSGPTLEFSSLRRVSRLPLAFQHGFSRDN